MRVYVAVFVYKGVLEGLEVHTDPVRAQARADEWKKQANPEEDVVDVLEKEVIVIGTPIKELALPWMYQHRLERYGIRTVEQLTEMSRRQLIFKRLIGEKCISLVKEALSRRGLSLADD
ncbi:hypothetical protein ES703_60070 [subsurface metagenome]